MFPDRLIELKITSKMPSQIGLMHLFCYPYIPQGSYRIFLFVFPSLPEPYKQAITYCAISISGGGRGDEPFQKGKAWQDLSFSRGVAQKKGADLFQGCCSFYKNKKTNWNLKYLMTKKFINKNVFLCQY